MPVLVKTPCLGCAASACQIWAASHDRVAEICCLRSGSHRREHIFLLSSLCMYKGECDYFFFSILAKPWAGDRGFRLGILNSCRASPGSWRKSHFQGFRAWADFCTSPEFLPRLSCRWKYSTAQDFSSGEESPLIKRLFTYRNSAFYFIFSPNRTKRLLGLQNNPAKCGRNVADSNK